MLKKYTILYWIWFWAILSILFRMTGTDWANIASVISAVILIAGTAYGIYKWVVYRRQLANAFDIVWSLDKVKYIAEEGRERRTEKTLRLKPNTINRIVIVVQSKQPYSTKKVTMQFNPKRQRKGHAKLSDIGILNVKDEHSVWGYPYLEYKPIPTGLGGVNVFYKEPIEKGSQDPLYLTLKIQTHDAWKGYLVFFSPRSDRNRGYGYLPTEVHGDGKTKKNN